MNRSMTTAVLRRLGVLTTLFSAGLTRADLVTEYKFDTKMQMTKEFTYDSGGGSTHSVSTYEYDELGRQKLVRRHATASLSEDQDDDNITLYVYDIAGTLTKLVHKGIGNSTKTSIEAGDIVGTYTYDALGRRCTATDSVGGESRYEYDLSGNVTKQRVLLAGSTFADTTMEYDYLNRATKSTDPEGHYREISFNSRSLRYLEIAKNSGGTALARSRWYYDNLGRVTKEGRLLDPTDTGTPDEAEDQVTAYVYDSDGRVLTQKTYNTNSSSPLNTAYGYNANGWLTRTTDPIGGYVQNLYDATGSVTRRYVYDIIGTRTVTLAYDALDRLTHETMEGAVDANDITRRYEYDGMGRRVAMFDPESRETNYVYDAQGRQVTLIEDVGGLARATVSIYDRLGRLDKLRAYDSDNAANEDTEYLYDLANRRTKIKYPDSTGSGDSVKYEYDLTGRMTKRKTQDNVFTINYTYDKRGLLTFKVDDVNDESHTFVYDGAGRMVTAQKGISSASDVSETLFTYNGLSQLTYESQSVFGTAKTLEYSYDQVGNRLTMKFEPSNARSVWLAYDYDDLSQNTNIQAKYTTGGGAPTSYQNLVDYSYAGRFLTKRSLQTRYKYESTYATKDMFLQYRPEYDDQRFMTKVTNGTRWGVAAASDHDELAQFTYTFDHDGNRTASTRHRGSGGNAEGFHKMNQIDSYGYDTLHRLTKVDYNNPGSTTGDEVYVYDSLGNRVTYTDTRNSVTRTYANNLANEYTTVATYAVTHDAAGNLSKQVMNGSGDAYVYTYDCDNRLLQVDYDPNSGSNTTVATFAYDALGRKITAWMMYDAPGGTQGDSNTSDLRFYHDGQVEIADYNASDGSLARRFINGTQYIDERAVLIEGEYDEADTYYYLLQELYTVTGLVEKSGALAEADVYDGYGKVGIWDYSRGDFDRDGDVDTTDQTTFNAALLASGGSTKSTTDPSTDLDYDGDTDLTDAGIFTGIKNGGGAVVDAFVSSIGNPFNFTGRRLYMLETLPEANNTPVANQQLQHNRARHYSPLEGSWLQRDPLKYWDSANLYLFVRNTPVVANDPSGLRPAPQCVVILALSHDTDVNQFEGESDCSAWGHIACNASDFNYEPCKDEKGDIILDKNGEPKLCPKPGSIPGLPPVTDPIGPGQDSSKLGSWDETLARFMQAARAHAEKLSKDCKCDCKQIVLQMICEWDPSKEPNINKSPEEYEKSKEGQWYARTCKKYHTRIENDGTVVADPKVTWRGILDQLPCKKKKKSD